MSLRCISTMDLSMIKTPTSPMTNYKHLVNGIGLKVSDHPILLILGDLCIVAWVLMLLILHMAEYSPEISAPAEFSQRRARYVQVLGLQAVHHLSVLFVKSEDSQHRIRVPKVAEGLLELFNWMNFMRIVYYSKGCSHWYAKVRYKKQLHVERQK